MARLGLDPEENSEEYEARWPEVLKAAEAAVETEHNEVTELGGLYVLGTERHESRRIDNQLRGRAGRQGDPGESRFYLSLTDDLMRLFNPGAAQRIMNSPGIPDDMALESKLVTNAIQRAQAQVESRNTEQRKNVLKYDDVMNRQREAIYGDRRHILEGDDLKEKVIYFIEDSVGALVDQYTQVSKNPEEWHLDTMLTNMEQLYPVSITKEELLEEAGGLNRLSPELLKRELTADAKIAYENREAYLGEEALRELERRVVLSVIGRRWQDHLYEMDYLKEGIGLRAMAQRDPLVEYQREGYLLFDSMMGGIREESVGYLFNLDVKPAEQQATSLPGVTDARASTMNQPLQIDGLETPTQRGSLRLSGPSESGEAETIRVENAEKETAAGAPAKQGTQRKQPSKKSSKKRRR